MEQNTNSKRQKKTFKTAVAALLVLAILFTGTYAWQSFSQKALNEVRKIANPGGRLHDDFDGTNKDVYVENFSDKTPILARVKLDEYLETGMDAGKKIGQADRKVKPLIEGSSIDDVSTWTTHVLSEENCNPIHEYWTWKMGGSTVFMPTFNKNKDSLEADINGTFAGPDGDTDTAEDRYQDYVEYAVGDTKTDNAIYDADDNTVDEGENGVVDINYTTQSEEHTAKETLTSTVMSMEDWIAAGSIPGPIWVYDTDGWAYWAQPIEPGEATGLLLDGIEFVKEGMSESCYYRINVTGQFATPDDWGVKKDGTGFFEDGITENGAKLIETIGGKPQETTPDPNSVAGTPEGEVVTIDDIEWYVVVKDEENNRALIWSKEMLPQPQAFGADYHWLTSSLRAYLNDTWLPTMPELQSKVITTDIKTRTEYNATTYDTTQDKVFLFTEADVFGVITNFGNSKDQAVSDDYTYNGEKLPLTENMIKCSDNVSYYYWLRSPSWGRNDYISLQTPMVIARVGTIDFWTSSEAYGVRPALWVKLN